MFILIYNAYSFLHIGTPSLN